jgi:Na+/H+ antiporter NhaD/arsenite permease-like protein
MVIEQIREDGCSNPLTVKIIYLANIIGSDIGSLLLPIGTLATLIWMIKAGWLLNKLERTDVAMPIIDAAWAMFCET